MPLRKDSSLSRLPFLLLTPLLLQTLCCPANLSQRRHDVWEQSLESDDPHPHSLYFPECGIEIKVRRKWPSPGSPRTQCHLERRTGRLHSDGALKASRGPASPFPKPFKKCSYILLSGDHPAQCGPPGRSATGLERSDKAWAWQHGEEMPITVPRSGVLSEGETKQMEVGFAHRPQVPESRPIFH